jgi:hypothetical protein
MLMAVTMAVMLPLILRPPARFKLLHCLLQQQLQVLHLHRVTRPLLLLLLLLLLLCEALLCPHPLLRLVMHDASPLHQWHLNRHPAVTSQ